jgi:hypothetical protein
MLCPAQMLGYVFAIRPAEMGAPLQCAVILSEAPRFSPSRGFCAARDAVEGPLFDLRIAETYTQESFFDGSPRLD